MIGRQGKQVPVVVVVVVAVVVGGGLQANFDKYKR